MNKLVCTLMAVLTLLVASSLDAQSVADRPDPAAVEAALLVMRSDITSEVWPGYAGPREFVLCPSAGGALLALEEPLRQLKAIELEVVRKASLTLYYSAARPDGLSNCVRPFGFPLEGRRILGFPEIDSVYTLNHKSLTPAAVLIHEGFHLFQLDQFTLKTGQGGPAVLEEPPAFPTEVVTSDRFQELAAREREILRNSLFATDTAIIQENLAEYLALRMERLGMVPVSLRWGEGHNEWKEGIPHYVATVWVSAESRGAAPTAATIIATDLESTPDFRDNPRAHRHWHIYASGAALGMLFDRLGVAWKQRAQAGATFEEILRELVGEGNR